MFAPDEPTRSDAQARDARTAALTQVEAGQYEAALYFPPDFAARLDAFRQSVHQGVEARGNGDNRSEPAPPLKVPSPEIIYSTANERSQIAHARLSAVLQRWTETIGDENLAASGVSTRAIHPFALESADVADNTGHRGAALWSKTLPVLLLLWALTGRVLPGRRSVRRRKGTRHLGNPAEQSGPAE